MVVSCEGEELVKKQAINIVPKCPKPTIRKNSSVERKCDSS